MLQRVGGRRVIAEDELFVHGVEVWPAPPVRAKPAKDSLDMLTAAEKKMKRMARGKAPPTKKN